MVQQRKFMTMLAFTLVALLSLALVASPVMAQGDGDDGDQGQEADGTTTTDMADDTATGFTGDTTGTAALAGVGQTVFLPRWAEVQLTPDVVVYVPQECVAAPFWVTRSWPTGETVTAPGTTVQPEFDESQQLLAGIVCDVAVFDTPGGSPVGSHRLLAGQTWFVKPYLWIVPSQQFGATDFGVQTGTGGFGDQAGTDDGLTATGTSALGGTTDDLNGGLNGAESTPDAADDAGMGDAS